MNNKGKDHRISILSYIEEFKQVEELIENTLTKDADGDNKDIGVLNYLQQRKYVLQREIQKHAEDSKKVYAEKLEEIKNLLQTEKQKTAGLEESENIKVLTNIIEYIHDEMEFFESVNTTYSQINNDENTVSSIDAYEEVGIIENLEKELDNNDNEENVQKYLHQRKYAIYVQMQNEIEEELENYTNKLQEITNIIEQKEIKSEQLEKSISINEENKDELLQEALMNDDSNMRKLIIAKGALNDLRKLAEYLTEKIEFYRSIDIRENGLFNMQQYIKSYNEEMSNNSNKMNSQKARDDNSSKNQDIQVKQQTVGAENELKRDKFLVVAKPVGRFSFIKNAWNSIKEKFTKNLRESEVVAVADEKTDEKPKEETLKERLGGYNSQNEFEKNAMSELEKQKQLNSETKRKVDQQYGE